MEIATGRQETASAISSRDVTDLLVWWSEGDPAAFDRAVPLIYERPRSIAHRLLATERPGHTLEATDLLHAVFIELRRS